MNLRDNKFVIIAAARTGSSMLRSMLYSHPDIISHGELFQTNRRQGNLVGTYKKRRFLDEDCQHIVQEYDDMLSELRKNDVKRYLYDIVFDTQDSKIAGFKFKTTELFNPEFSDISDLLIADKDIKIIFLKRNDLLSQYISQRCVSLTGINRAVAERDIPEYEKFDIYIEPCMAYLKEVEERAQKAAHLFKDHRSFDISYEDVVSTKNNCLQKMLGFLGVNDAELRPKTIKLLSDNYALVNNLPEIVGAMIKGGLGDRILPEHIATGSESASV